MPNLVRVRKDGFEYNVGRAQAKALDLDVIDSPTHYRDGRPIEPRREGGRQIKPRTTVAAAAKKKAAPRRRAAKKTTVAKKATAKKAAPSAKPSDTAPSKES